VSYQSEEGKIMDDHRENELLKELDRLAFIGSAFLMLILIVVYFVVDQGTHHSIVQDFVLSVVTNLIPVLIIFVASYVLFRRVQEIRSEKSTFNLVEQMIKRIGALLPKNLNEPQISEISCYQEFDEILWKDLVTTQVPMRQGKETR
jgi:uncharacterized membrane protein YhaH (DUF805 family)